VNKLLSYITYIVLGVVGISILFGICIVFPIYKGSKGDIIPLLTLFGIIFVLCYKVLPKVNRDKLKIKMNSIFYRLFALLAPIFGKSIKTKYIRLITSICMLEEDYVIMDLTRERCVIKNIDKEKQEVFKWELYKDFKNRDAWDYQQIRITCTPLSGNCKIPITIMFDKSENQKVMFSEIMGKVVNRMNTGKEDINISKKENKERKEESASKPVKESKENIGIKNSWSLLAFAKKHGKMQVGDFANKDTGEVFKACIFTKPDGTRTFVAFAAKMGELTPKQIAEMKNELQVVQLESGNYSLCKIGSNSWKNVDLESSDNKVIESLTTNVGETDSENSKIDEFGVEYSSDMKILKRAPHEIIDYPILDGTEIISDASFSNCENLVSVTIPRSIKTIGHYAFAGCKKIFSIIIPEGIDSIGDGSFMNCETLKTLRLPASLISISDDAFEGCNNLNTIFVPEEEKIRFEAMLSKFDVNIAVYNSNNVSALDELLTGLLDESGVLYSKDGKVVFTHTKELSNIQ
jgi:hypothetical protein